jgi:LmbE family N-acetylglucosaminyl deacetylase
MAFLRLPDWFLGEQVEEAGAALREVLDREMPDRVYLAHENEWHPDHAASLAVVRSALAGSRANPDSLLTYEVWTPMQEYCHVEDVGEVMRRKLRAIRCYASQLRGFRYDRAVRGLNAYRGVLAARCMYAEVFGQVDAGGEGL